MRHLICIKSFTTILFCILYFNAFAQHTITGTLPDLAGQQVKLTGFEGFNIYAIDSAIVNEKGIFQLAFNDADFGMGYLSAEDNEPFILILAAGENVKLKGEVLAYPETVEIISGKQNLLFGQYAAEHPRREQALSAWDYLERIYLQDSLFAIHKNPKTAIKQEKQRIKEEDKAFLESLDPDSYISWYLPLRKLVSSVPVIAQYRTEEIPAAIASFRSMDYTDPRLYKSGLLRETIENHFWLIENSGRSLDSVFIEMNISIDHMIENLVSDEKKLNEITDYLFRLLEQRSLFESSEYLALKVLNELNCTIDYDLAAQLESYRAMKTGNTAPDFDFGEDYLAPGYDPANIPQKLSDLNSAYTLVVFGASWCPQCPEELLQIAGLYEKWKKYKVEVVYVSLDEDKETFKSFAGVFPFISICDYQKWESPVVNAWHVFATPTMYLLDDTREILLRPNSVKQMDAWVDWFLVQGNDFKNN
ncbi:MAG: thioredoxin-like domain-containing protein [Bacteroidales bacterium]